MKKFYIIGILLIVLLAFVACDKKQVPEQTPEEVLEEVTEVVQEQTIEQTIEAYELDVATWSAKEIITPEDVTAINEKIAEMKEKAADLNVLPDHKTKIEELVQKLEDLKVKV